MLQGYMSVLEKIYMPFYITYPAVMRGSACLQRHYAIKVIRHLREGRMLGATTFCSLCSSSQWAVWADCITKALIEEKALHII